MVEIQPIRVKQAIENSPTPRPMQRLSIETAEPTLPLTTPSRSRTAGIIACITCITGISNLLVGFLTVCTPIIATELGIPPQLQLWPASAYALACGCTLLICATVADVVGCRQTCLLGALVQTASALGAGLSRTSGQLIALRAVAGVAASLCLPSAVGIVASTFPAASRPRSRSAAFAAMGGGRAVGFGLGLTLGGVFSDTIGWRWGFHTTAVMNLVVLVLAWWWLPNSDGENSEPRGGLGPAMSRLAKDVDWVGALIISTSLALLSYELAVVAGLDASRQLRRPVNFVLLATALALVPAAALWMRRQTRLGKPALIPNHLWRNVPFTAVCTVVFLVWGALNASEQLTALYLQEVRGFSTLTASLYFLPAPICGVLMSIAVAVLLPYIRPSYAVPLGCLVSGVAPLLLAALCRTDGPSYWRTVFEAMAINPLASDLIYTIANLVVTDAFPAKTQALAGGVFNMLAQIGTSVGIATTSIIAHQVTAASSSKEALMRGYTAGWWFNCGLGFASVLVSFWGLRGVGKLGVKKD